VKHLLLVGLELLAMLGVNSNLLGSDLLHFHHELDDCNSERKLEKPSRHHENTNMQVV
jgi:hypothetical protein